MKSALKEAAQYHSLWKSYRDTQDSLSQEQLVVKYMYLVEKVANRISASIPNRVVPKEDLMGMGYIGLIEAIRKFDYQKGYNFETYGLWRIKGAMLDGLRKLDWVPRGVREKAKKMNIAMRDLEQSLLRTPSQEELSEYLQVSAEEIDQSMSVLSLTMLLSLNEQIKENDSAGKQETRLEKIVDENSVAHEMQLQMAEFRKLLAVSIDKMPEKERLVITLLYYEGLSQVEIAEVLDLTKGRISQLHSQAILRIRKSFQEKGYSMDSFI
ncbi:sigma-70 family RNA polymerase sigma factor [Bacillus sp. FJAT-18017]|uniref:sigma-70 family RNA polymerase sigma factor n=1 Tax=Bacillus sp. FJAT-18017 TaxID=1705566 RepID=UPI0006AFB639|nr:FliA/WhiG family RNA polymerase sigma factor [Bacillus sp. FJAT-18017]